MADGKKDEAATRAEAVGDRFDAAVDRLESGVDRDVARDEQ